MIKCLQVHTFRVISLLQFGPVSLLCMRVYNYCCCALRVCVNTAVVCVYICCVSSVVKLLVLHCTCSVHIAYMYT